MAFISGFILSRLCTIQYTDILPNNQISLCLCTDLRIVSCRLTNRKITPAMYSIFIITLIIIMIVIITIMVTGLWRNDVLGIVVKVLATGRRLKAGQLWLSSKGFHSPPSACWGGGGGGGGGKRRRRKNKEEQEEEEEDKGEDYDQVVDMVNHGDRQFGERDDSKQSSFDWAAKGFSLLRVLIEEEE